MHAEVESHVTPPGLRPSVPAITPRLYRTALWCTSRLVPATCSSDAEWTSDGAVTHPVAVLASHKGEIACAHAGCSRSGGTRPSLRGGS